MTGLKRFFLTTILGGVVVLAPGVILLAVFLWLFNLIRGWIQPLTDQVVKHINREHWIGEYLAIAIVLTVIVALCFIIGLLIKTAIGRFLHSQLEQRLLSIAPGYNLIKETVMQFLGRKKSPFSSVAPVRLFGNDTYATAFVTDEHANGYCTVFVPSGPNPTSGLIYHVAPENVVHIQHPVEDVMRSIISCGAGSVAVLEKMTQGDT